MDRFCRASGRSSLTISVSCLAACVYRGYTVLLLWIIFVSRIILNTNSATRLHIVLSRLVAIHIGVLCILIIWEHFWWVKN